MWSRVVIMCCFCLLLTGVSSCPKKEVSVANKMNAVIKQIGDKRVFFGYDESSITEMSADALLDAMEVLQDNPDAKVTLTGHTDNRGSHEYNLALGARRADAAKKFMVSCASYLENRIKTASKAETEPLVDVKDDSKNSKYEKDHAKNRRVEFSFSGIKR
ncbi:peptidoglycan-associated lipoprotein,putative [Wolbachia endosymbiont of Armadillidium vulgare str. wVulC]|uniref:OmpA family protein n=1 Tax=Wolbachia endosymbiont of Armadillidium vulgare TaxID=77039 RepID=UPI00064AB7FB|nr:OmpA family protein [Wolbachia endosymbiont of Armadillidium vulgare]KLT22595.1 peptidoglycan-associated lipoprotein,putative [Wolbachia endosymbiont of Armadillidium vulgare str. wVulC]OJH31733.1 Outer membrane lipoprotein Omp16 precursor [Wolbachia endosymbiont of Armadillidium vulgare]OJH32749.1 Outer membrane lipoprotein Omp16 precursor [Wolbachia endosymbiont of Armadillidium vulgare]OJH33371.1 Outer membrane lipoprotein Omp16 precursor [Wolbachia endosymbiont of Armadillidium vulgare]